MDSLFHMMFEMKKKKWLFFLLLCCSGVCLILLALSLGYESTSHRILYVSTNFHDVNVENDAATSYELSKTDIEMNVTFVTKDSVSLQRENNDNNGNKVEIGVATNSKNVTKHSSGPGASPSNAQNMDTNPLTHGHNPMNVDTNSLLESQSRDGNREHMAKTANTVEGNEINAIDVPYNIKDRGKNLVIVDVETNPMQDTSRVNKAIEPVDLKYNTHSIDNNIDNSVENKNIPQQDSSNNRGTNVIEGGPQYINDAKPEMDMIQPTEKGLAESHINIISPTGSQLADDQADLTNSENSVKGLVHEVTNTRESINEATNENIIVNPTVKVLENPQEDYEWATDNKLNIEHDTNKEHISDIDNKVMNTPTNTRITMKEMGRDNAIGNKMNTPTNTRITMKEMDRANAIDNKVMNTPTNTNIAEKEFDRANTGLDTKLVPQHRSTSVTSKDGVDLDQHGAGGRILNSVNSAATTVVRSNNIRNNAVNDHVVKSDTHRGVNGNQQPLQQSVQRGVNHKHVLTFGGNGANNRVQNGAQTSENIIINSNSVVNNVNNNNIIDTTNNLNTGTSIKNSENHLNTINEDNIQSTTNNGNNLSPINSGNNLSPINNNNVNDGQFHLQIQGGASDNSQGDREGFDNGVPSQPRNPLVVGGLPNHGYSMFGNIGGVWGGFSNGGSAILDPPGASMAGQGGFANGGRAIQSPSGASIAGQGGFANGGSAIQSPPGASIAGQGGFANGDSAIQSPSGASIAGQGRFANGGSAILDPPRARMAGQGVNMSGHGASNGSATGIAYFPPFQVDTSCTKRLTDVEDILCMKRPQFLPEFKNPCWYHAGVLRCLPYFYIIGVCKTGTTDLFERLSHHPQIVKNNGILGKETWYWTWQRYGHANFYSTYTSTMRFAEFVDKFDAGAISRSTKTLDNGTVFHPMVTGHGDPMDFYFHTSWKSIPQNDPDALVPEVTTPTLVKHVNPDVKLILILRDPIERLFSNYLHGKFGETAEQFHNHVIQSVDILHTCTSNRTMRSCLYDEMVLRSFRVPLSGSFYSIHLQEWLKAFPRKQLYITKTEYFAEHIAETLLQIFRFLRLDPLPTNQLYGIANMAHFYNTKARETSGDVWLETRTILQNLFQPYNKELVGILKDDFFNFNVNTKDVDTVQKDTRSL